MPREVPRVISLITRGTSRGQILQTIPKDFPLFFRLWASTTEEDAAKRWPMGLYGETVGLDLLKSDSVKSRRLWLRNKDWYKQWKVLRDCLEYLPAGGPSGIQSDYPRDLPRANFSRQPLFTFYFLYHTWCILYAKMLFSIKISFLRVTVSCNNNKNI